MNPSYIEPFEFRFVKVLVKLVKKKYGACYLTVLSKKSDHLAPRQYQKIKRKKSKQNKKEMKKKKKETVELL